MGADPVSLTLMAVTAASGGLKAYSQHQEGQMQSRMASVQADQMRQKAKQEQAIGQRRAAEHRRKSELDASRAIAVNAAHGGTTGTKSMLDLLGEIASSGDFNARSEMFDADMKARDINYQAKMTQFKGRQARRAANMKAIGTLMSTATSMASMGAGGMSGGGGGASPIAPSGQGSSGAWSNPDMGRF